MVGKWGVERWFRVPGPVYRELQALRTASTPSCSRPTPQAPIPEAARRTSAAPGRCRADFTARTLAAGSMSGSEDWAAKCRKGQAFLHVFRKTALQYARRGEDINRQVARTSA